MSSFTVEQLKSIFESLATQYTTLFDTKTKLEDDCKQLREYIENQVSHIKHLNVEFEKLKKELHDSQLAPGRQPTLDTDPSSGTAQEQSAPVTEEITTQNWEVTPLIPPEQIEQPMIINFIAEIVDLSVIWATAFSPDGTCLAIGSDRTVRVYNIDENEFVFQECFREGDDQMQDNIKSIVWTQDSKTILCCGEDGKIRVYSIPEQKCVKELQVGTGELYQVAIAKSNEFFVTVSDDSTLTLVSMDGYQIIDQMKREGAATSVSISPDDKMIAVGYADCVIALWDVETRKMLVAEKCHDNGVYAVPFLPQTDDKLRIASASLDNTVKLWDIVSEDGKLSLKEAKVFTGHSSFVISLAVDPTGEWLLSGSKDLTARLSSVSAGVMVYCVKAHTNTVMSVAFSPKGNMFCTGSGDQSVRIWSLVPEDEEDAQ